MYPYEFDDYLQNSDEFATNYTLEHADNGGSKYLQTDELNRRLENEPPINTKDSDENWRDILGEFDKIFKDDKVYDSFDDSFNLLDNIEDEE